ncbi:hypothetical protein Lpp230_0386 [Lacticaseibacillus paracasei subsp. paracasei Lpp230]|nr:hypothetical protein Lpp230_0386 [Lacticaseibacillus paracasei subsp. paracasei Lpp230]
MTRPLKTVNIRLSNQLRPSNSVKSFSDGLFDCLELLPQS